MGKREELLASLRANDGEPSLVSPQALRETTYRDARITQLVADGYDEAEAADIAATEIHLGATTVRRTTPPPA